MKFTQSLSRREFLKLGGMLAGAAMLPKNALRYARRAQQFSEDANLGRVCVGDIGAWHELKSEPSMDAPKVATAWRDDVLEIKREVVATTLDYNRYNQRWYETPNGYIYAPMVQPVKFKVNTPVAQLPLDNEGKPGMWVEITQPVVDMELAGSKENASYWIRTAMVPRLYYSQVYWASNIRQANGKTQYLLYEKYGALPDSYWVDAEACRPITAEEIAPIHPDVGDKLIKIDYQNQTLSCLEGNREVYFCEVSTGYKRDGEYLTPGGVHTIWRKLVSVHMSAGGVSEYDSPGIGWTTIFHADGQAIHAVYWHNNFGSALSHGCVNCRPDDAKWIWRWCNPQVNYYPGELTVQGGANSTKVEVDLGVLG